MGAGSMRAAAAIRGQRDKAGSLSGASLIATELAVMFVGATLPTPLYTLYRHVFGFGGVTLTLIYAVYVLGNLTALLIFGRLSDQIGRRAVTLPAIGVALLSTLAFLFAQQTAWLFVARVLSGFATGLASGAATAWIVELLPRADKGVASRTATSANFTGLAIGALLTGILVEYAPWPLRLTYAIYLALLLATAIAVLFAPETVKRRSERPSLKPRLGVPRGIWLQFLPPAVTGFVTFALLGFYAALIPSLLAEDLHYRQPVVAGGVVFGLFLIAAAGVLVTGRIQSRKAMLTGLAAFVPAVAMLVLAQMLQSMSLLLAATALAGIAAALGYRGSLEVVNSIAPGEQRSEVISSYLMAMYIGNSLPVIGIGVLTRLASSLTAHLIFAGVIAGFAVIAIATGLRSAPAASK
jgi:MFS family permease